MTLEARLHAAHAAQDRPALVALYQQAATTAKTEEARFFYLTQAYVYALDSGAPEQRSLQRALAAAGRL